jgi:beta-phosphoglucomutase-like phosphatase (HAD superfamily)
MPPPPRALIFDFDGVLADSEPLHLAAFQRALAPEGIVLTREDYYASYLGYDDGDAIAVALRRHRQPDDGARVRALMARKAEHFLALVGAGVPLFPGAAALVREAAAHVPLAIGSGALRREIELILNRAGLRDCFAAIVSAEDVAHGKPAPDTYLRACVALGDRAPGLLPAECTVVEDSPDGVEAARRAGMRCLAVCHSAPAARLQAADVVVERLEEVTWSRLAAL